MIKITSNFDNRKFMRELEQKAFKSTERQLRDLTVKGLKIKGGTTVSSGFRMKLDGPAKLIEEAKRRFG